jgi:hypothetical protein
MSFVIAPRFNGPPNSGNGGYVAGRLAAHVERGTADGTVEVTLRSPPPLGVRLEVRLGADAADVADVTDGVELYDGQVLVAQGRPAELIGDPQAFVSLPVARAAAPRYAGRAAHPFPTCFVCGLDRDDGLALQPGPVGAGTVAAVWTPDVTLSSAGSVASTVEPEFAWAALDCPGGWSTDLGGRPMVLGRMTAKILRTPSVGEQCVVVGNLRELDGRKAFTASALYDADGELLGFAEAVWLQVDPATIGPALGLDTKVQGDSRSMTQGPEGSSSGRR